MIHWHSVEATARECVLAIPGDEMIRNLAGSVTNAITVHCNRRELWPWLIQMGADRAGWYSYDRLDNGGRHSADRIIRELQSPPVGAVFPASPGMLSRVSSSWRASPRNGLCLAGRHHTVNGRSRGRSCSTRLMRPPRD